MSYGLTPRPIHADDVAAVVAGLAQISRPAPSDTSVPAWRFSGRWFHHGPYELRRPRR